MILITAQGRLAATPTLRQLAHGVVCEFRLLSTRFAKNQEHTEAVNFFCYGEDAERFCDSVEMGQLISATGSQETSNYSGADGSRKTFVKYRMTWFEKGARPYASRQNAPAIAPTQPPRQQNQSAEPKGAAQPQQPRPQPQQSKLQPAQQQSSHQPHQDDHARQEEDKFFSESGSTSFDDVSDFV